MSIFSEKTEGREEEGRAGDEVDAVIQTEKDGRGRGVHHLKGQSWPHTSSHCSTVSQAYHTTTRAG